MQKVVGRTLDVIRTREGRSVPGEFFPHLLKEVRGVRQFQVVQTDLDTLVIKIVKDASFDETQLDLLRNEVARLFGQSITVRVEFHDRIPLTKAGKLRLTVSEIDQA
jgi:phenylacetate-CoA ligase